MLYNSKLSYGSLCLIYLLGILLILPKRLEIMCKPKAPNIYSAFFSSAGCLHRWADGAFNNH